MIVYHCFGIIANIAAIIVFHRYINITALSSIPLFLITLSVFQALIFKNEKTENGFRTAYGSNLTAEEENKMLDRGSSFILCTTPLIMPFVFFFPSFVKALSVLVYLVGLIGGLLLHKVKNKEKIMNRMNAEEIERQEQEKKEQLGKWK